MKTHKTTQLTGKNVKIKKPKKIISHKLFVEMILTKKEAVTLYNFMYALTILPKNRFLGLDNFLVKLSELLIKKHGLSMKFVKEIQKNTQIGVDFGSTGKSKMMAGLKEDKKKLQEILKKRNLKKTSIIH